MRNTEPTLLLLLLMAVWFLASCARDDGDGGDVERSGRPASTAEAASPAASATAPTKPPVEDAGETAGVPRSPLPLPSPPAPAPAADGAGVVEAPGIADQQLFELLADSYERIDPAKDGWDSEAFSAAASAQLKELANLYESGISDAETATVLENVADPGYSSAALRPADLEPVFEDRGLAVTRAQIGQAGQAAVTHRGRPGLLAALRAHADGFGAESSHRHLKLKLFTVDGNQTQVIAQATAEIPEGKKQMNATWRCTWNVESGASNPLLSGITVLQHEESIYRGTGGVLFRDCTEAVLGGNRSYREQLLQSSDHWRLRITRDLGLDVVANHGLAIGDVNGDDLDDLYLCQQGGLPNRLFIQQPDGTLKDFSRESGADWLDYSASALFVDFDNDGNTDLLVGQELRLLFMSNDGTGRFTLEFGTSTRAQTFSLAAADYDNDGDVDVYSCGYNPVSSSVRQGAMGEPIPYHDANNGGPGMLLRNEGNWIFEDVTGRVGLDENNTRFSFAASWEDYDNDGDVDLYVANDYGRNNLYRNDSGPEPGSRQFRDVAGELGVEDMSAGMSVSWADCNRDGWMDFYVSNMFSAAGNRITYQRQFKDGLDETTRKQFQRHARGNSLFQGNGKGGFDDVSVAAGVTMGRWAWGSTFADLNNDGWEDLLVANGFISTPDTDDL